MNPKYTSPRVFFPRTISEVLDLAGREPNAVFWAGGTHLAGASSGNTTVDMPRSVISLGLVEELARASRSEHSLEIGAMMTLDRMAAIGRTTLPAGLYEAITDIGNRPLRCRATIGGQLAMKERIGDLKPLLQLLETQVEIRYLRDRNRVRRPVTAIRRIPVALLDEGEGLSRGELITRVSIPVENWTIGLYKKVRPYTDLSQVLVFTALARIEKGILAEWRMAVSGRSLGILRDRDLEVDLTGRALPLGARELDTLDNSLNRMMDSWENHPYEKKVVIRLARGFLDNASD